jgi:REP element-mobilizing transposase RayT
MPRPLRVEFAGAIYHLMSRGDHREAIFLDDEDRQTFLRTLGEACEKTGWRVHAYCLMGNHFHLVTETPQPNLVAGMKWFLGTYTGRFNRRHHCFGHLLSGRYKSVVVDERTPGYLRAACDYVHLNPVRAGLVPADARLSAYPWSSYPLYVSRRHRPPWLRADRLLGEHGIQEDSAKGRSEFQRRMEQRRREGESPETLASLRRGWRLGAASFLQRLTEKLGRRGQPHELARERRETDAERADQIVRQGLEAVGWSEADLDRHPKGHPYKAALAHRLRRETPMTRAWIARRLRIGSASYVSYLVASRDCDLRTASRQGGDCRL